MLIKKKYISSGAGKFRPLSTKDKIKEQPIMSKVYRD